MGRKHQFIALYILVTAIFLSCGTKGEKKIVSKEKGPNIIYVLADDLGYGDITAFNPDGKIQTPNIDKLASDGMIFTDAHTPSAVCTPTRYGILTGRYNWRSPIKSGVLTGKSKALIPNNRTTVASLVKKKGYATAFIGKWHIGAEKGRWPTDHGFDEFYGPARSYDECMWDEDPFYDPKVCPPAYIYEGKKGQDVKPVQNKKLTYEVKKNIDLEYLERAKTFITEAVKKGKPFYLYYNPHYF